ncbi:MAG TPA: hypothetical protein VGA82_03820 [Dehalococcoidales bacterium]
MKALAWYTIILLAISTLICVLLSWVTDNIVVGLGFLIGAFLNIPVIVLAVLVLRRLKKSEPSRGTTVR